ncbi:MULTISPECIES: hypothetical protein [Actinomadura]|uniref:Uncharacterized protein n=1 Tax=Actinomadura yumaensis TaxID=111807 RepID=A0ABW2CCW7_9ACTN|nr:hypothetical protein [Actinomadura sp. J1-007]MWK38388.1 hypothetical protein [Actinomadura sp. J1-007]
MTASNPGHAPQPVPGGARDHGWTGLREERVVYGDLRVRQAAEFVTATGIVDQLQALITRPTGSRR